MINEIALIMAAGLGTRMRPLTEKTAKPLIKVKGTPMIETVIETLKKRGDMKIFIMTGYKKEQFKYLTDKYNNVTLLENKEYMTKNNISSLKAAENILGDTNCFICEADLYISDRNMLLTEFCKSCYLGKYVSGFSDEWVFITEENTDRIIKLDRNGTDLYNMCGISFWLKDDIQVIMRALNQAYDKAGHEELYWDEIVDGVLRDINVSVSPVKPEQIIEIDTVAELKLINEV
ncbi:MAG: sugar phosphate nucleotidyltransferase [Oscillospiraceae bacterium]|nr:sugar phosphate nucleotidyltransferase [Oscillospiraceae bacterium]